jgi:hypothetical protein
MRLGFSVNFVVGVVVWLWRYVLLSPQYCSRIFLLLCASVTVLSSCLAGIVACGVILMLCSSFL